MKSFVKKHTFVWPLLGCAVIWILIGAVSGQISSASLFVCAKLATFSALLALAQMIVVTSGDGAIDLSQMYILTLTAYVSCSVMETHPVLGFAASIAVGALCGMLNGFINVVLKIPAMVATLAAGYIVFTVVLVAAPGMKALPHPAFVEFININFGPLSMLTVVVAVVAALLAVLLYKMKYGRQLHAVGQNRVAAGFAGVPVKRTVVLAFVLGGALCGLSGALCGAFNGGAFQDMGSPYFLPSVTAAVVGGPAAAGGKSDVLGVCLGALMMSLMTTFLNTTQLSPGLQRLILGVFLVSILLMSVSGKKK
jgi:ribose transport system permease protein